MGESLLGLSVEESKPVARERLRVLITVKAAPNPSEKSGETVCVAGVALRGGDVDERWVRLYPINYRFLEQDQRFKKYDIVELDAVPASGDPRVESWKPDMSTMKVVDHLDPWKRRRAYLDPLVEDSMCALNQDNRPGVPTGRSLALIRPRGVKSLVIKPHPGWSEDQERKIVRYTDQLSLLGNEDRTPLEAPRMRGWYLYTCWAAGCAGHRQGILDWEFVALQRQPALRRASDEELRRALSGKFLDMMCRRGREVAFYVGNLSKRHHVFSVLGVYYPS